MNTQFRIYTESTGGKRTRAIVETGNLFDGFTVIDVEGYWKGAAEESIIIEIMAEGTARNISKVETLARCIKRLNDQDAVLVTETEIKGRFI